MQSERERCVCVFGEMDHVRAVVDWMGAVSMSPDGRRRAQQTSATDERGQADMKKLASHAD